MYKEEEFLQLSGIQHFAFCRRQWALAYIEMQWQENVRTVEGKILHENAHDPAIKEKRGDLLIVRAMPVHSREMGVSGECDVVEFHKVKDGISIAGREGSYSVIPVEYKRGKPKTDDSDILQVAAQALCLEEMLCCVIPYGYIYYGETRRRTKVEFTDEVREKVTSSLFQLTTSRRGRQQFVTKSMDINHRFHNKSHNKSLFFALIILCLSIFH